MVKLFETLNLTSNRHSYQKITYMLHFKYPFNKVKKRHI